MINIATLTTITYWLILLHGQVSEASLKEGNQYRYA